MCTVLGTHLHIVTPNVFINTVDNYQSSLLPIFSDVLGLSYTSRWCTGCTVSERQCDINIIKFNQIQPQMV
jgi:hypothetical protein